MALRNMMHAPAGAKPEVPRSVTLVYPPSERGGLGAGAANGRRGEKSLLRSNAARRDPATSNADELAQFLQR